MRSHPAHRSRKSLLAFAAASLLAITATAQVTGGSGSTGTSGAGSSVNTGSTSADTSIDASGNYRQEVQACESGRTAEARDTCLREARNARADKQRHKLDTAGTDLRENALARCQPFSGEDKAACEARVMGYGESSGSVAGGGVLRQVETVVVPPGQTEITIEPKTSGPVVVVPMAPADAAPGSQPAPTKPAN